jgi:hypothetical protein
MRRGEIFSKKEVPIRGVEPRATAEIPFTLKGGNVNRYTISDFLVSLG